MSHLIILPRLRARNEVSEDFQFIRLLNMLPGELHGSIRKFDFRELLWEPLANIPVSLTPQPLLSLIEETLRIESTSRAYAKPAIFNLLPFEGEYPMYAVQAFILAYSRFKPNQRPIALLDEALLKVLQENGAFPALQWFLGIDGMAAELTGKQVAMA